MSDAVADRGRPEPRYWIRCERDGFCFWSSRGIPNFIRIAIGKTASIYSDQRGDPGHRPGTRLKVYRFAGIHSAQLCGQLHWHHVGIYIAIDEQPAQKLLTSKHAWEKWLRENDTEGDILSPRVDRNEQ